MGEAVIVSWFAVILLIPILGVMMYRAFTKSTIAGWMTALTVGGGTLAYLIVLMAMMLISGTV